MYSLEKVRLGKTKLQVTRLGMGGAPLGGLYNDISDEAATTTIHRALELGVNFFDTAPLYGHGKSELRVGRALADRPRNSYVLGTKVGRVLEREDPSKVESIWFENLPPFKPIFDFTYDGVMRSFAESLNRLNLDRVDVLYIHDPDDAYDEAIEGAYRALDNLRSQGVIGAVGVGMNQWEMLVRFAHEGSFDCFLLAGRYTLIDHTALTALLPLCLKKGISIIIGGPYNSGILATGAKPGAKFDYMDASPAILEKVHQIENICSRHSVPLRAAALQFPLAHPAVATVIPGARSVREMEENFHLMNHPIPPDLWAELRSNKLLPPEAPVPAMK